MFKAVEPLLMTSKFWLGWLAWLQEVISLSSRETALVPHPPPEGVGVAERVGTKVGVEVGVEVFAPVAVAVKVVVFVGVDVGVEVLAPVGVGVEVKVLVGVGLAVGVIVLVGLEVGVAGAPVPVVIHTSSHPEGHVRIGAVLRLPLELHRVRQFRGQRTGGSKADGSEGRRWYGLHAARPFPP